MCRLLNGRPKRKGASAPARSQSTRTRYIQTVDHLHSYVAVGLPVIAVLASLVVSQAQISGIRGEMTSLRSDVRADSQTIREDIREMRASLQLLTGKVYEMMGDKH